MNYKCVEIPEPDFDASFTDEMVVTAYQDEDDFNPQMTDEYPNIRLTQLETDIQQTSLTAAEAFEAAGNAEQLANQAAGIAEGAATTAGETAQSINEHASSTTNPHPTNVTQEFADTQITQLAVEATYTPTVWSYLVGLFTSVPKSVKEHIVKGWTVIENLKSRVTLLEDNYILKYVVPTNTTAINLTTDRYGNPLNLTDITIIADIQYTGPSGMHLRINNITEEVYRNFNLDPAVNIVYRNRFYIESGTNFILQKSVIDLFILSNEVVLTSQCRGETPTPSYVSTVRGVSTTVGMNINAITTINIISYNAANSIKAGSVILIKKR